MEEQLTRKLTGALFGFKNGTKTAQDVTTLIKSMREVNALQADSWNKKLLEAINEKKK